MTQTQNLKICSGEHTHTVEVVEDLMHSHYFVVELVVAVGGGQERVAVRYEHVEQIHHLEKETRVRGQKKSLRREKGVGGWVLTGNHIDITSG